MKYILKKLWPLIILLAASISVVCFGSETFMLYDFLKAYLFFAVYVLITGFLFHFIGEIIPRKIHFETGFFSCHSFEDNGKIYNKMFKVSAWKEKLFDASMAFPGTQSKKTGLTKNPDTVLSTIQETCIAEMIHWILLLLSPLMFAIIQSEWIVLFYVLYVFFNIADIIIQRYNRPKLISIYTRLRKRKDNIN